ncbi:2-dehydro-3-deoxygalactonokinase [Collimonas fungivorans Ter331]|uniref:2-dehydro-3-deoxygalactonokinase n=2 Tax=Collimonas fungivorans TaxID=158899 RepID=G0AF84_COLFT|nr:2-dehydro-3-deoxygalactonokinase [Collimonas fungivorans Ter331]
MAAGIKYATSRGTLILPVIFKTNQPMPPAPHQTHLIALDWGTSSLRAYRLGAHGQTLELRALPCGIMQLPAAASGDKAALEADFEAAFEQACGDWLRAEPGTPVIAAGMVGSRQGWLEVPYLEVPIAVDRIGASLSLLRNRHGQPIHLVPGLIENAMLPNVMRGEETQVVGVLNALNQDTAETDVLIGLPGTHSKWVQIRRAGKLCQLAHFDTFMTGEVFAALSGHTILGRGMQAGEGKDKDDAGAGQQAFERGALVARSAAGQAGVLSTIFSTRTLGLTGVLDGAGQREYLSGLLIGHEIAALQAMLREQGRQPSQVMLVGEAGLCARYTQVLRAYDFGAVEVVAQATERGLWQLALTAGLLKHA